jgi:hypothetical protein
MMVDGERIKGNVVELIEEENRDENYFTINFDYYCVACFTVITR